MSHPSAASPTAAPLLLQRVDAFGGTRVAILGDYMLDRYLYGDAERVSPEAPVPVLRVVRREAGVGGAASVAADVAALGGAACCIGIVGDDDAGRELRERLATSGVRTEGLIRTPDRPTTVKTRLVGLAQHRHRQQIVRVDEEISDAVDAPTEERLIAALQAALRDIQILCIQDYGKGVASPGVCRRAIEMARRAGLRVLIDPMRSRDTERYAGAWLSTPNRTESETMIGKRLPDVTSVCAAAKAILAASRTEQVCVTLDAEGCALIGPGGTFEHLPTRKRDVYDVTGAGDQVLAALAVALAAGSDLREAAALANIAGGLEVERFGCVPVTRDEMIAEILLEHRERRGKLRTAGELRSELSRRRSMGQTIVFTNGCFDLLHRGHVEYLAFCRRQGEVVVVGLNTDASVRRQNKAPDRPVNSEQDRAAVIAGLESVDYVVLFDEETPASLIEAVQPDVLVKGEDWAGREIAGRETVERRGGRVVLAPLTPGRSTTDTIGKIRGKGQ